MRDLLGYTETDDVSLSKRMGHLNTSAMEHLDGGVQDSQLLEGQKQDACKAHQRVALRSLPRLSVNAINTEDLESIFSRPRTSRKKKPWMYQMYRRQDVRFRESFFIQTQDTQIANINMNRFLPHSFPPTTRWLHDRCLLGHAIRLYSLSNTTQRPERHTFANRERVQISC
jgi:hypothetical protein